MPDPFGQTIDRLGCKLQLSENDMATEALCLIKSIDMETGDVSIFIVPSEGLDWIAQRGLMSAAQHFIDSNAVYSNE